MDIGVSSLFNLSNKDLLNQLRKRNCAFPLLRLPNNTINIVLRNMNLMQQLGISLISKKTKQLVKDLDQKKISLTLCIKGNIEIHFFTNYQSRASLFFYTPRNRNEAIGVNQTAMKLDIPKTVSIETYERGIFNNPFIWVNRGNLGMSDWMKHFFEVFNISKINQTIFQEGCDRFDIKSIRKTFNNFELITICKSCSDIYSQSVMRTFSPRYLEFYWNPIQHPISIHKTLNQNFDYLTIYNDIERDNSFNLDHLLAINSSNIKIYRTNLAEKDLNRFIKHWMNGSNQRMEHIFILFRGELNRDIILNGLNYETKPAEQQRIFKHSNKVSNTFTNNKIKGGFDILRNDKTNATIVISQIAHYHEFKFEIFVWP